MSLDLSTVSDSCVTTNIYVDPDLGFTSMRGGYKSGGGDKTSKRVYWNYIRTYTVIKKTVLTI